MFSEDCAVRVEGLSKCYHVYNSPRDRLKQFFLPRLQRLIGASGKEYFTEFWALKDVSFDILKGETVGIIGKNGSGKSTLLQLLCGTLHPSAGHVTTFGRIAALLELGSGFNPEFSGRENIYLNAAVLGLTRQETDARLEEIISFADIGDFLDRPVKVYSSGMYVRLAFAIQACIEPDILIVDEALAVGDAHFVHKCMDRIHQLQKRGCSILLVTHDAHFVKRFCDRAVWIKDGRIAASGNATDVVDRYLEWLFNLAPPATPVEEPQPEFSHGSKAQRRVGDGACKISSIEFRDDRGEDLSLVHCNSRATLTIAVSNVRLPAAAEIIVGYIVKNARGEELAASNSFLDGNAVYSFHPETQSLAVTVVINIPHIQSGHYSLSVGTSYRERGSLPFQVADRLLNARIFAVKNEKDISTPVAFPTEYLLGGRDAVWHP